LKNNLSNEFNAQKSNLNENNLSTEFNQLTSEINNNKPSLRDLINSAVLKQQKKSKKSTEGDVSYREWIKAQPINFDPRSKEERQATVQIRNENSCEDES